MAHLLDHVALKSCNTTCRVPRPDQPDQRLQMTDICTPNQMQHVIAIGPSSPSHTCQMACTKWVGYARCSLRKTLKIVFLPRRCELAVTLGPLRSAATENDLPEGAHRGH